MKKFWYEGAYKPYRNATDYLNYPEIPFGNKLRDVIRPTDRVADIGCGFGIVSRYLAHMADSVLAIDQDANAIAQLKEDAAQDGITNIDTLIGIWPNIETEPWDVAIAFYHHMFAETTEKVEQLVRLTKREGLVTAQGNQGRESFHEPLMEALGLAEERPNACANGCYVRGRLEQAGCECTCEQVEHDFGQPTESFEDAVTFMMNQLGLDPTWREKVEALAPDYVTQSKGQWYVPITRHICLIHFKVPHAESEKE